MIEIRCKKCDRLLMKLGDFIWLPQNENVERKNILIEVLFLVLGANVIKICKIREY